MMPETELAGVFRTDLLLKEIVQQLDEIKKLIKQEHQRRRND